MRAYLFAIQYFLGARDNATSRNCQKGGPSVKPWNNCTARTEENGPLQKTEYQFDSCSVVVHRDTNKFKLREKECVAEP